MLIRVSLAHLRAPVGDGKLVIDNSFSFTELSNGFLSEYVCKVLHLKPERDERNLITHEKNLTSFIVVWMLRQIEVQCLQHS
jgi:hypothetical protein